MKTAKFLSEFSKQFSDSLPPPLKALHHEFEQQFHQALKMTFEKLELVTREEFETQMQCLARAQDKIRQLENRMTQLEAQWTESSSKT